MANYLCQNRHGTYYFRCVIPFAYRKYFKNKREIRYSLKTDSKKVALPKSRLYRVWLDRTFEDLATMHDDDEGVVRTGLMTHWGMFGDKTEIDHGDDKDKEFEHVEKLKDKDFERAIRLNLKPEEIIRLQSEASTKSENHNTMAGSNNAPTWDDYCEKYLAGLLRAKKIREETATEYQASYILLSNFAGADRQLVEFDADLMTDFYESLSTRAISTQNKHLTRISSVFKWAVSRRVIPFNPIEGVMTLNDGERKQDKREMFDIDDLKKVFESDYYSNNTWRRRSFRVRTPYTFWMFPLALFTGARMSELLLLETANVHLDEETPYLDLLNEIDSVTGEEIKKLKNNNSIRQIPISDTLIEMGFANFVRSSRDKYLFPDIVKKATTTDAGQKVLSGRLKKFDVWVANSRSFHSFRHTFINAAALSGIDLKYLSAVTGHLSKEELVEQKSYREMASTYLKDYSVEVLKAEVIDKLKFDVDFSGVKWPK